MKIIKYGNEKFNRDINFFPIKKRNKIKSIITNDVIDQWNFVFSSKNTGFYFKIKKEVKFKTWDELILPENNIFLFKVIKFLGRRNRTTIQNAYSLVEKDEELKRFYEKFYQIINKTIESLYEARRQRVIIATWITAISTFATATASIAMNIIAFINDK